MTKPESFIISPKPVLLSVCLPFQLVAPSSTQSPVATTGYIYSSFYFIAHIQSISWLPDYILMFCVYISGQFLSFYCNCLVHFSHYLILGLREVTSYWSLHASLCPPPICHSYSQRSDLWSENKAISLFYIILFIVSFLLPLLIAIFLKFGFINIHKCFRMLKETFSILCVHFVDNHCTNNSYLICVYDGISVKEWPKLLG